MPVPCAEVTQKNNNHQVCAGVPLRLAWALSIHKSQGIVAHEGCIVSFDGVQGSSSVSKLGLAFVALTRTTTWAKMVFHKLPRFEDFLSARLTNEFEAKSAFESKAGALFTAFLQRRGITEEALLRQHEEHYKAIVVEKEKRIASDEELADLRAMLSTHGVAPLTDSVKKYCADKSGRKVGGLWSFVASFRAEKEDRESSTEASAQRQEH